MIFILPFVFGAIGAAVGAVAGAFTAHAAGEKDRQAAKHHRQVANELTDKYANLEKKYHEFADESKKQIKNLTNQNLLSEIEKDCLRLAVRLQQNVIYLMWEIDKNPTADALNRFQAAVEKTNQVLDQLKEELIIVPNDYYVRLLTAIVDNSNQGNNSVLRGENNTLYLTKYENLKKVLKNRKWKEANEETRIVMLKIAGKSQQGFFQEEDIEKFPLPELDTIDELWRTYSYERFGFTVQKRIWQNVKENWHEFGNSVGWGYYDNWDNFQWISQEKIIFRLTAPEGHLPAIFPCVTQSKGFSAQLVWSLFSKLFVPEEVNFLKRLENIEIYQRLKHLLAACKWREANEETRLLMLKIAGRSQQGFFQKEDIEKFTKRDLDIIDRLWRIYSDNHFGFSVQRDIWQEAEQDWHEFGNRLKWRSYYNILQIFQWITKHEITFSLDAPKGHLPAIFPSVNQSRGFAVPLVLSVISKFEPEGVKLLNRLENIEIYQKLKHLLAAGKWKEANEETRIVMLKIAGRNKQGFFQEEDIEKFPLLELDTINKLWRTYSYERFGFTAQKRIWQNVKENWHEFGNSVGWGYYDNWDNFQWISQEKIIFKLTAPEGHLPAIFPCVTQSKGFSAQLVWSLFSKLFVPEEVNFLKRLENIEIYQRLKHLLAAGKWREANEETRFLMLKIAGRSQQGFFQEEDIDKLLCRDLYIIEKLWVIYSEGNFGFSVQKDIWQNVKENWHEFGNSVGWGYYDNWDNFQWISQEEIIFKLTAPEGHLPAIFPCVTQSKGFSARLVWSILSKFDFI